MQHASPPMQHGKEGTAEAAMEHEEAAEEADEYLCLDSDPEDEGEVYDDGPEEEETEEQRQQMETVLNHVIISNDHLNKAMVNFCFLAYVSARTRRRKKGEARPKFGTYKLRNLLAHDGVRRDGKVCLTGCKKLQEVLNAIITWDNKSKCPMWNLFGPQSEAQVRYHASLAMTYGYLCGERLRGKTSQLLTYTVAAPPLPEKYMGARQYLFKLQ
jgi:hypothetical protein